MQNISKLSALLSVLVAFTALCGATPTASAQATDGRGLFEAAARAIEGVDTITARMTLEGGGSKSFLQFMPSGEGVFRAKRIESDEGEPAWATRIVGAGKDRGDGEEYTFDAATMGDEITWIEHRSKSVNTSKLDRARGVGLSMRLQMNIDELLSEEPLARELDGLSFELKERETVAGVVCDVVQVEYAQDNSPGARGKAKANKAVWYLGVEDHLPRRIERITDADIVAISLILTLEDVRLNAEITPEDLQVDVPDGYKKIEPRAAGGVPKRNLRPTAVERGENASVVSKTPSRDKAPSFSVLDASGTTVSNETQAGRVSVIYFWGTWCVPCRAYSPLISGLAETFAGQDVDILAPAVRSGPAKAKAFMKEKAYTHRLLVDADTMARSFRVRVYPTIFVIDETGGIVATETPSKDETPEQLIERIEQLVRDELTRIGEG